MLIEVIRTLSILQPGVDDDFVDRLSYYYTSTILVLLAILVSFKMFGGRPMECWVPAEYSKPWEDYSEVYCWAKNTYWVPFYESNVPKVDQREARQVSYYQWTPFYLLVSALAFYFPCILWRMLNDKSGIRLTDIIEVAADKFNIHEDTRRGNLYGLASHLISILRHRFAVRKGSANLHRVARCLNCRYYEAYMTMLYLFVKLLYLFNVVGQLFLMNRFLQTDGYTIYGFGVLKDLIQGRSWLDSGNFPRVTLCDMQIRVMGQVQRHTVQCVLVINIFTEKIFILLWLWYSLLSLAVFASFCYWAESCLIPRSRLRFIARNLELADIHFDSSVHSKDLKNFINSWIRMDGIFVLKMITIQAGAIFSMQLVDRMWEEYLTTCKPQKTSILHNYTGPFRHRKVGRRPHSGGTVVISDTIKEDESPAPEEKGRESEVSWNSDLETPGSEDKEKGEQTEEDEEEADPRPNLKRKVSVLLPLLLSRSSEEGFQQPPSTSTIGRNRFSRKTVR